MVTQTMTEQDIGQLTSMDVRHIVDVDVEVISGRHTSVTVVMKQLTNVYIRQTLTADDGRDFPGSAWLNDG